MGKLGRTDKALAAFNEALKIDPKDEPTYLHNKGIALGNLGKLEEALVVFDEVLKINPQYKDALSNKGVVLGNLSRWK